MSKPVTVVVGDIHGCLEEFDELLKTIQYNPNQMRLVLLGDLLDRGPDSVGCVRRARALGAECIMGNHEEKHLRWQKHEKNKERTGKPNPMKPMGEIELEINKALNDQDWTWLKSLPIKLDLGLNWWAVHAGCEPRYSLQKQNPSQIMRVRYVDERGVAKALNADKSQPEGTVYWDELWKGPESLIYGHCVHDLKDVRTRCSSDNVGCIGIDTGCCFGGHLTAALMGHNPNKEFMGFAQVKAKKQYYVGYENE
jgi:bis(5'-nucleosyl)-tetraphosphatase (symmetrical)